jgi:hypothetical protein
MMAARLTPEEVERAPELLVLASLDATLHALGIAIIAAFPELLCERDKKRDPPLLAAARRLNDRARMLAVSARLYREELECARPPDPPHDLPF